MQDALLIYLMITNMRHAGGFRFAAYLVQEAGAQCMAVWFAIERYRKAAVATIGRNVLGGNLLRGNMFSRNVGSARGGGVRRRASALAKLHSGAAIDLVTQCDWLQALTRLENYVVSMR
jgi:hypothetical protein